MPTPFLMYHELRRPGVALCDDDPGYVRYVVDEATFRRHLAWVQAQGVRATTVGDALRRGLDGSHQVVMTFDDGCESDWTMAAPLLAEHGFGATFYVVAGWVGRRRGFADAGQLRQLAAEGFEIGSHSMSHAFLSDLDRPGLHHEIVGSKKALEDLLGAPVLHFSCPGGRWSRPGADLAREAGYESMATSRLGPNGRTSNRFALRRYAIQRGDGQPRFEACCQGAGLWMARGRERVLAGAKALLGTRVYWDLRSRALKDSAESPPPD